MKEQPQEATFVKLVDTKTAKSFHEICKVKEQTKQLREIDSKIRATQAKFELPQGPAFINGRWW